MKPLIICCTGLWLSLLLAGCDKCPDNVANLKFSILEDSVRFYDKIYAIHGNGVLYKGIRSSVYTLPLSFNDNTITYIFEGPEGDDTLTISYKVGYAFKSKTCGFVININDINVVKPTSFEKPEINLISY